MESSLIIVFAATATAAGIVALSLVVSKLVRRMLDGAVHPEPNSRRLGRADREATPPGRSVTKPQVQASEKPPDPPLEEPPAQVPAAVGEPRVPHTRSVDVKQFRQPKFERPQRRDGEETGRSPQPDASSGGDDATYRHVGEEVAAVLTAAEQAAAQIRETALREAEQTKAAASDKAAATLADAEARRREADRYSGDVHANADAYAEETRRRADEDAAKRLAAAEEQARQIRVDAEKKASKLVAEAVQRRDTLAESTKGLESRVDSMLTTLRDVTTELEELLPKRRQTIASEAERPADATLETALEPSRVKMGVVTSNEVEAQAKR